MNDMGKMFEDALKSAGVDVVNAGRELQVYAAERVAYLAKIVGQPGYEEALATEARNVALKGAIAAVGQADATDQRIVSLIQGALSYGAVALAAI